MRRIITFLKLSLYSNNAFAFVHTLVSYSLKLFETRLLLFSTSVSASFRWSTTRQLLAELSNSAGNRWEVSVSKWRWNITRRKMSFSVLAWRPVKVWMRWARHYVIIFVIISGSIHFYIIFLINCSPIFNELIFWKLDFLWN